MYGIAALFNGPLVDRIGGRAAMLLGLAGATVANAGVGLAALGHLPARALWITVAALWAINGVFQSFSALALVKVNAAWFGVRERGLFSAIFSGVIQAGRALVFLLGAVVLSRASWAWMFLVPAAVTAGAWVVCHAIVRDAPVDCGLQEHPETGPPRSEERAPVRAVLGNPVVLAIGAAQACTGIARHGFEQWFPRYLVEVHALSVDAPIFRQGAFAVMGASILGAMIAGSASDRFFGGRRAPVALAGYALQILSCAVLTAAHDLVLVVPAFVGHAIGVTVVHSMLAGTAPMDFGGRGSAATAAGLFDGMHYLGGAVAGVGMGRLLDRFGWQAWAPALMSASAVGLVLMARLWHARPQAGPQSGAASA